MEEISSNHSNNQKVTCHYFVDEAGDGTLFNSSGKVIIGNEGCSKSFILGVLEVANPIVLRTSLESLRHNLMADPYFKDVPSMQPEAKKTAIMFHAKDDVPEVRREVFNLLLQFELKFLAVARDKRVVLDYVRQRNQSDNTYRYHPNELYDYMVRRLFKTLLHKADEYIITFSKRGKSDRTTSLKEALSKAKLKFEKQQNIQSASGFSVVPKQTKLAPCLQATDYFLWALQRYYERHEDRYIEFLWSKVRLVHDMDDTRRHNYGEYYTRKKPLSERLDLKKQPGI